jgi:CO/xanthine dehydrogenase FAD-binding subunit
MKPADFELRRPHLLSDALASLAALGSDARVLAGGQSLLPLLRYRVVTPHVLIDINGIEALRILSLDASELRIGALVRHAELEKASSQAHGALAALLAAHAREIAFWAVRNRGTAVGSLVQADPKGDWPLLFCALDARIELASLRGVRSAPVREFIEGPLQSGRAVDEIATAITLPGPRAQLLAWGRSKLMHRAGEYAMCSAVALRRDDGWHCWLGAVGDRPQALPKLQGAMATSSRPDRATLLAAARADIDAAWPDVAPLERHRHAVNAVDAAERAVSGTPI